MLNGTVAESRPEGRLASRRSPLPLILLVCATVSALNLSAEPQASPAANQAVAVAITGDQALAADDSYANVTTVEVTTFELWPAWNLDRLNYRPSPADFLTQNEIGDEKHRFASTKLLIREGELAWSNLQAGYGKTILTESSYTGSNGRDWEDTENFVYVKFSRAF